VVRVKKGSSIGYREYREERVLNSGQAIEVMRGGIEGKQRKGAVVRGNRKEKEKHELWEYRRNVEEEERGINGVRRGGRGRGGMVLGRSKKTPRFPVKVEIGKREGGEEKWKRR